MPTVPAGILRDWSARIFVAAGLSPADADLVADSLVDSNLAGHDSHGVLLLPRYVRELHEGTIARTCQLTVERETPNTARINANLAQGHVAAQQVTRLAIAKAQAAGVSTVTVYNLGHIGRLGKYVEMAAAAGCVALATINNHGKGTWLAPHGGSDRRLSPNPLGIGAPTGGPDPLVLDMSASVVAAGKCLVAQSKGERIPPGWMIDHTGQPTTDPAALMGPPAGALLPLGGDNGGHKGYALAFLMDVLGGALSGAGCSRSQVPATLNGLFLTVVRIENFVELADFTAEVDRLIAWCKASPPAPAGGPILYPGEFEARHRARRSADGIPLPESVCNALAHTASALGVAPLGL